MTEHARVEIGAGAASPHVFLVNGTIDNWYRARRLGCWGLPSQGVRWPAARARLQELGFGSASIFIAVAGPRALFSAVVDGDPFFDDTPIYGGSSRREPYAVCFRFTRVVDEPGRWLDGALDLPWRAPLVDLFFGKRSLYTLSDRARAWQCVRPLLQTGPFRLAEGRS